MQACKSSIPAAIFLLRPGNVVLFHVPTKENNIEVGFVLSVWKGIKNPKLNTEATPIDQCSAFRVLVLDIKDSAQEMAVDWVASNRSSAYVVRLESLITILDCEKCSSATK